MAVWPLALVAYVAIADALWPKAPTGLHVAAVAMTGVALVAGTWNARQIPRRARHPLGDKGEWVPAVGGLALLAKVVIDRLSPEWQFFANTVMGSFLLFIAVGLPIAYREQRRRDRADREWSTYAHRFERG